MPNDDWNRIAKELGATDDPVGRLLVRLGPLEAKLVSVEAKLDRPAVISRKDVLAALSGGKADFWRLLGWQAAAFVVAVAVLSGSIGFASGWWWHGEQQLVAGVSTGQSECRPERGGEACVITFWKHLPTR